MHLPRSDNLNNERNIRTEGTLQRNGNNWTKSFILLLKFLSSHKNQPFSFLLHNWNQIVHFNQNWLAGEQEQEKISTHLHIHTETNQHTKHKPRERKGFLTDQLGNLATLEQINTSQTHKYIFINLCVMHWIYTKQTNTNTETKLNLYQQKE